MSDYLPYLGKSKIDTTMRISIIKEVAELLEAQKGDFIEFHISGGKVIITRDTPLFDGHDFEGERLANKIMERERSLSSREDKEFQGRNDDENPEAWDKYQRYLSERNKTE